MRQFCFLFGTYMVQNYQNNLFLLFFVAFQNRYCKSFTKPIRYIGLLHSTEQSV